MRLINCSASFSDKQVREIVRFVRPPGISNFTITIRTCRYRGHDAVVWFNWKRPRVLIHLRENATYPFHWGPGRGYIGGTVYSREEALVAMIAHELRHLWQIRVKKGRRVWNTKIQISDRDADAYMIHMIRAWRRRPAPRTQLQLKLEHFFYRRGGRGSVLRHLLTNPPLEWIPSHHFIEIQRWTVDLSNLNVANQ